VSVCASISTKRGSEYTRRISSNSNDFEPKYLNRPNFFWKTLRALDNSGNWYQPAKIVRAGLSSSRKYSFFKKKLEWYIGYPLIGYIRDARPAI